MFVHLMGISYFITRKKLNLVFLFHLEVSLFGLTPRHSQPDAANLMHFGVASQGK